MIDTATFMMTGTTILAGAGVVAGHAWRTRQLSSRFTAFRERLDSIETTMYTHEEPEHQPLTAPDFELPGPDGASVSLGRLRALGKPVLLVFTDPVGETGRTLLSHISDWQKSHDAPITVVGIAPGQPDATAPVAVPEGIANVLYQGWERHVAASYGVVLTPAAVLVAANGALAGKPVVGMRGIDSLLESIARAAAEAARQRQQRVEANAPTPGSKAPRILLPDLDDVDREVLTGESSQILLFWSPNCGYCDHLIPDLHALEAAWPNDMPPMTLVARGSEEDNRAQGFGFRMLMDHDLSASEAFGVSGTPAAIVVDADGTVVSPVARGIRSVRDLLGLNG
jgi:peroxiredoxin/thiol-disulfide isomerase/thioredoxin